MASFVEQATLKVKDNATSAINKINKALKDLFATAKSLKSIKVDVQIGDLKNKIKQINDLAKALKGLKSVKVTAAAAVTGGRQAARSGTGSTTTREKKPKLYGGALLAHERKQARLAAEAKAKAENEAAAKANEKATKAAERQTKKEAEARERAIIARGKQIQKEVAKEAADQQKAKDEAAAKAAAQPALNKKAIEQMGRQLADSLAKAAPRAANEAKELQASIAKSLKALQHEQKMKEQASAKAARAIEREEKAKERIAAQAVRAAEREQRAKDRATEKFERAAARAIEKQDRARARDVESRKAAIRGALREIITPHEALRVAGRQAVKGTTDADIGRVSLELKEMTPEHRKQVDELVRGVLDTQRKRPGGAMWNIGQIERNFSEMLGVVKIGAATSEKDFKERAKQAQFMTDQNLELARTMVTMGVSAEKAEEESIKYSKAIEISGKATDESGKFEEKAAARQYNLIRSLIPSIGKEMTGQNYLQLMKHLQTQKFSLSDEGMALAMADFEEQGTRAATSLNQMVRNLSGRATKGALAAQAELGLIGTETVTKGRGKRARQVQVPGEMPEAQAALLRENPQAYVNTILVPALKKELMLRKGMSEEAAEKQLDDAAYVSRKTGKLFSDRSAQERATALILRRQENAQFLADWRSRQATLESQRRATAQSITGAIVSTQNQIQGAMGQAIVGLAPVINPVLTMMGDKLAEFSKDLAIATEYLPPSAGAEAFKTRERAQAAVERGAIHGLAFGTVGFALKNVLTSVAAQIASPIATAQGLATLADPTAPGYAKSLAGAGINLNAAADKLSAAAHAQTLAATVGGGVGGAGGVRTGTVGKISKIGGAILRGLPYVGTAAALYDVYEALAGETKEEGVVRELKAAESEIAPKMQAIARYQNEIAKTRKQMEGYDPNHQYYKNGAKSIADYEEQIKTVTKALQPFLEERERLKETGIPKSLLDAAPSWFTKKIFDFITELNKGKPKVDTSGLTRSEQDEFDRRERERAARREAKKRYGPTDTEQQTRRILNLPPLVPLPPRDPRKPVKVEPVGVPLPRPRPPEAPGKRKMPGILGGVTTPMVLGPDGQLHPVGKPPAKVAAAEPDKKGEPAADEPSWLAAYKTANSDAARVWQTSFSTVAADVAKGGTDAAGAMQQAAGGIGGAIGEAFLAKANQASVTLNINPPGGGGAPKGTQEGQDT